MQLKGNLKWKQDGETIAGGNGKGNKLNQLSHPRGIYVDDEEQCIYSVDNWNHRIVKSKLDGESDNGEIVAGGNGQGNRTDQLNRPADVILDKKNKSLIICDSENRRVVRWPLENRNDDKEILIENLKCWGLMMNENGDLFVSDLENDAVKRWRKGEIGQEGTIVAGGNGTGNQLNQLHTPSHIFIDREETVYVADRDNHRVMKWLKDANEGIIVAGGQGTENSLKELNHPYGLLVNEVGDIYVADWGKNRIMCWPLGSEEGRVILSGYDEEKGSNRFYMPIYLSLDVKKNLYVADHQNHRIQRFRVD